MVLTKNSFSMRTKYSFRYFDLFHEENVNKFSKHIKNVVEFTGKPSFGCNSFHNH